MQVQAKQKVKDLRKLSASAAYGTIEHLEEFLWREIENHKAMQSCKHTQWTQKAQSISYDQLWNLSPTNMTLTEDTIMRTCGRFRNALSSYYDYRANLFTWTRFLPKARILCNDFNKFLKEKSTGVSRILIAAGIQVSRGNVSLHQTPGSQLFDDRMLESLQFSEYVANISSFRKATQWISSYLDPSHEELQKLCTMVNFT